MASVNDTRENTSKIKCLANTSPTKTCPLAAGMVLKNEAKSVILCSSGATRYRHHRYEKDLLNGIVGIQNKEPRGKLLSMQAFSTGGRV